MIGLILVVGFNLCAMSSGAAPWSPYGAEGTISSAEPGGFNRPVHAAVDSEGNVYVADVFAHDIRKLTVASGEWAVLFGNGASAELGEFNNTYGVAVDGEGNIYVADEYNHRIQKYASATGEWSAWGKSGGGSGSGLGEFNLPTDVAVDSAGNLYVTEFGNHRVQKFAKADGTWSIIGGAGSALGTFHSPFGVAVDEEDNVYIADAGNNRIQKLTVSTGEWQAWGKPGGVNGKELGEFVYPSAVAVDGEGNLYVADSKNHRVQKWAASTETWSAWGKEGGGAGRGLGEFDSPEGVAVDGSGNLYVADTANARVQMLSASSGQWIEWGVRGPVSGAAIGEFNAPLGVAFDASGNLYVADTANHRVQKLTKSTGEWSAIGRSDGQSGGALGEFYSPYGVAVDGSGNVYVADRGNQRIQILSASTGEWSAWGTPGTALGQFRNPAGVAVDGSGNVYVADQSNNRIQKRSSADGSWSLFAGPGAGVGQVYLPAAVAVDSQGNLYVAEPNFHRVQRWTASTGEWTEWKKDGGGAGDGAGEFNRPMNVAADGAGNVYAADSYNNRIQKLSASTGEWSVFASGIGGKPGEFSGPVAVAVDRDGNVAVAENGNHRIQILTMPGAPAALAATAGDGEVTVSFAAPANAADSAVTGYTVTAQPGGITASGASGPITVTGLTNGITYTFTVTAMNAYGSGAAAGELTATPQVPAPGAPVLETPQAGNAQVALKWSPVEGAEDYKVFMSESAASEGSEVGDAEVGYSVTEDVYSSVLTGLTNGKRYYFVVKAVNDGGDSPASNQVSAVPMTVPGAPKGVTAVAGDGRATVSFQAPDDDGGSPVTSYEVTASSGAVVAGTSSPIVVAGLTNGTSYTFTVRAVNAAGAGLPSDPSNAVIPAAPAVDDEDDDSGDEDAGDDGSNDGGSGGGNQDDGNDDDEQKPSPQPDITEPQESPDTGTVVLVNGKAGSAGAASTTVRNGRSVTTIAIDDGKLAAMLAAEEPHAVVAVPVTGASEAVEAVLTGRTVKAMENKQAVLEIRTDRATYTLPAGQIQIGAISRQIGGHADLADIRISIEIAVPAEEDLKAAERAAAAKRFAIVAPPLSFTVRGTYGDRTVDVSAFDAYVQRTVAIPDGVDPNRITTGVAISAGGAVRHVPTKIVFREGRYHAVINSLTNSVYAVIWNPLEFADAAGHWAEEVINDMGSRLVVDGTGNLEFDPDREITRAEFSAILVRALGLQTMSGSTSFTDVPEAAWFHGAIQSAYAHGLVQGFEDGSFRPNETITREQGMVILAKAMALTKLKDKLAAGSWRPTISSFRDAGEASGWALTGIAEVLEAGIVAGRDGGELAPKAPITRAEAAMMAARLLKASDLI